MFVTGRLSSNWWEPTWVWWGGGDPLGQKDVEDEPKGGPINLSKTAFETEFVQRIPRIHYSCLLTR